MTLGKARVLLAGVALGALQVPAALAQDANRPTELASGPQVGAQLSEIVVTAQKRSQKINDVGMAITAATGRELIEKNVTSVDGLTRIEPSLQFSQSNNGTPVYTIRGVGYFEQ